MENTKTIEKLVELLKAMDREYQEQLLHRRWLLQRLDRAETNSIIRLIIDCEEWLRNREALFQRIAEAFMGI